MQRIDQEILGALSRFFPCGNDVRKLASFIVGDDALAVSDMEEITQWPPTFLTSSDLRRSYLHMNAFWMDKSNHMQIILSPETHRCSLRWIVQFEQKLPPKTKIALADRVTL